MIVNEVKEILPEHLPDEILSKCKEVDTKFPSITALDIRLPDNGIDFNKIIEKITFDLKKQIILRALDKAQGNKTKAARLLGLSRSALGRQIEKLRGSNLFP
jgi:DNA-binding NtrC family response regulator